VNFVYIIQDTTSVVGQAVDAAYAYHCSNTLSRRYYWLACLEQLTDHELAEYLVRMQMIATLLAVQVSD
jgi:hypothetical protein